MKFFLHKFAAFTVVIFISTQPVSIDVMAAEKEPLQDIGLLDDDKTDIYGKRKGLTESTLHYVSNETPVLSSVHDAVLVEVKNNATSRFSIFRYVSKKATDFMAWFNMDIEADLH
jgi:hypothetical protein